MDNHMTQPPPKPLNTWIAQWLSTSDEQFQLTLLAGDGSPRKFYRLQHGQLTYLVVEDTGWHLSKDYPPHQQFLKSRGMKVPDFIHVDEAAGIGVMQDLGDELAQRRILRSKEERQEWLKKSAATLADLHRVTYPVPTDLPAASRSFDQAKYFDELSFTFEHLCRLHLNLAPLSREALSNIQKYCDSIASLGPKVFCHRDYHARNLMIFDDELYLIDFQDARLGSPHYDLASLIYDPYISPSPEEEQMMIETYRTGLGK